MYTRISDRLLRTRDSFTSVCKELNIDPEWADPDMLYVTYCDHCGYWDRLENMHITEDGDTFCKVCIHDEYFIFK